MVMDESTTLGQPCAIEEVEIYQEKVLGRKWKRFCAAVYENTSFGRARLELFPSKDKVRSGIPFRTILLTDCVSLKASTIDHRPTIRIHLKDDVPMDITCSQLEAFAATLSSIAFPKNYVTIPSASLDSPSSEEDFVLSNEYPVLLLPSTLNRNRNIAEGNYSLHFHENLIIKNGDVDVHSFEFADLLWVAAGENCLGFSVEGIGVFEFICASPLVIVQSFRCHVRFGCNFTPLSEKTKNKYNRCYYPERTNLMDTPGTSNDSTMESKLSKSTSKSSLYPETTVSMDSSFTSNSSEPEFHGVSRPSELRGSGRKAKLLAFFRRSSKKKNSDQGRTAFEENADGEWLRIEKECENRSRSNALPDQSMADFRLELENTIADHQRRKANVDTRCDTCIPEE